MRLLIVGTLEGHISAAGQIALQRGAKVSHVDGIEAGLKILREGPGADLTMVDIRQPVAKMLKQMKQERINCPVVACGVQSDPDAAVAAIRAGAKEYMPLPPNAELIAAILAAVAEEQTAVIFRDPIMAGVLKLADQIAPSDASVLITGESGTGKEVLARYVHAKSRRTNEKFVSVNCAAIPDNLLESELFGHEKGAFTGAVAKRIGKFEEAHGGTLLLDEISEMDIRLQAKLLRAIQEREIDRVGGSTPVKVDIRLIATSNRDLERHVQNGHFREDLYFRLNVFNLQLPALRDRPGDIRALANHFVKKYAEANDTPERSLTEGALARLESHTWRGNVRELENTMHRAVLLAHGDAIDLDAIILTGEGMTPASPTPAFSSAPRTEAAAPPPTAPAPQAPSDMGSAAGADTGGLVGRTVADVERHLIIDTLSHCLGNRTHAANILGISIRTLRNKVKQYTDEGFEVPSPGDGDRVAG
ncbi:sigma-54 interaction domain-containing protein [Thalassobaculum litoreum]|uniref:DNA-binding transcriptional response regulator, NtrC family, contains REC, AAA-type ATPase, and a Fis-type DNA-binding domains n=1 Tax=Thalassobaculum litoreum DSM 18839 TaxID=1123362 RepID=A0A8G2BN92_9PROT|nr:sigma-54 dependent transcriptional regulator [Thalassobaculum litoreum]SDG27945.1 DNA-binding transcriptional response regulator, NtrC family, contains REC, AAA-type ATPase, and a Fis-type DNA-binding domains [Thalassobaculum litoreum DSM 18839]